MSTQTRRKLTLNDRVVSYLVTHPKLAIRIHKVTTWLRSDTQAR